MSLKAPKYFIHVLLTFGYIASAYAASDKLYFYFADDGNLYKSGPSKYFDPIKKPPGTGDLILKINATNKKIKVNGLRTLNENYQFVMDFAASMQQSWGSGLPYYHYIYTVVPTDRFYSVAHALREAARVRPGATEQERDTARAAQGILQRQPQIQDGYLTADVIPRETILQLDVYRYNPSSRSLELVEGGILNPAASNPPAPAINPGAYPVRLQESPMRGLMNGVRRFVFRQGASAIPNDTFPLLTTEELNVDLEDELPPGHEPGCSSSKATVANLMRVGGSFDACLSMQEQAYPPTPSVSALTYTTLLLH